MNNFFIVFAYILLINMSVFAQAVVKQNTYTISGYIKDAKTGEELIGATVMVKELVNTGTTTNAYGFYSITVPEGNYTVIAQFIGYVPKSIPISLHRNLRQDYVLMENTSELKTVTISAEKDNNNVTQTQMGVNKIDMKDIQNIPVLMGEKDILKTISLLPGVQSAGEGSSGFYVRGGTTSQNLILLDEATVYNASHLLGFFSVFNADALKDVTLFKGSQPAEYGGRLASVLDIKMKDGNDQKFNVEGGIGLIASRLKLEGPIKKNKGSYMIAARRTYADLFLKLSPDSNLNKAKLYFYDINAKANYHLDDKNTIYLSGYYGKDVLGLGNTFGINWGNTTGTFRWNHLFNQKLFSNTSLIYTNYDYTININTGSFDADIISRIRDYNLKQDFQYFINSKNELKFGINSIYHQVVPGEVTLVSNGSASNQNPTNSQGWENAAYVSHIWKPNSIVNFEYGLRLSTFSVLGPGSFYTYDANGNTLDTSKYNAGKFVKTYINLEPRFAANYILNEKSSLKFSYNRNTQNMHLLTNSTSGSPTDAWIMSSINVKPEIADQISLGYFRNFINNTYEFSSEVYYKSMQNQIDYRNGAQLQLNENIESQLLYGIGRAYGIEFFVKKKVGRFNGWVSYTLSKVQKKIDGINNDNWYLATQDRTNDISIVGIYQLSKKITLSATFVYYTGNPVTFPVGKYEVDGQVVSYYTERNGSRMPDYNRLDLGVTWLRKKTARFESSWNFSVYNAYGRENAYTITFQQDPNDPSKTEALQTSLFRWVPGITYNFKF